MSAIVAPPEEVGRRAEECIYVLIRDFDERIPAEEVDEVLRLYQLPAFMLQWQDCRYAFELYDRLVERRT